MSRRTATPEEDQDVERETVAAEAAWLNAEPVWAEIRRALRSHEYPCPGGHRLDGVRGDMYDYADEMMDELGYPAEWDLDRLAAEHPDEAKRLREKQEANWVETGKCAKTVEIYLESDGEYGEIKYPVADGECVAALGMDEDFEYERPLWQRAFERWSLERRLRRGFEAIELVPLAPVRRDGGER